ncbi:kinesin-like protein KIF18A, partial [Amia ocellicauda]|uniref:kinesin-like protein KIF18A n=1 Tax=Amia ocellicauda TaxID=2972642 RepID=UPI003463E161
TARIFSAPCWKGHSERTGKPHYELSVTSALVSSQCDLHVSSRLHWRLNDSIQHDTTEPQLPVSGLHDSENKEAAGSKSKKCSHVKVVVRLRPEDTKRKDGNIRKVVHVVDDHVLVFDPKEQEIPKDPFAPQHCPQAPRFANRDDNKKAHKDLKFIFDNVLPENSTQLDVFESSIKGVVDSVLNGYNGTVFAYGATGAGKTHTMLGTENEPGVMYLTMKELYSRIDQLRDEKEFDIAVSYLEVYNEQIRDLLSKSGPLTVQEERKYGIVVPGLSLHQPKSAAHVLKMLENGNKKRTQLPTPLNTSSSRSHAVFQIYIKQHNNTHRINQTMRVAKLNLVDLAGSERGSPTNAKGVRTLEGANINRSLLVLGRIISALADPKMKKSRIPYRDSKLTYLLKDSLGGNCFTTMIANISPSSLSYTNTYNTLTFASRAKEIKASPKSNVVKLDSHFCQYVVICDNLKKENLLLQQELKEYKEKKVMVPDEQPERIQEPAEIEKPLTEDVCPEPPEVHRLPS